MVPFDSPGIGQFLLRQKFCKARAGKSVLHKKQSRSRFTWQVVRV